MAIPHPYLLFLGDAPDQLAAKTGAGVAQWRRDWCLGQHSLPGCNADLGLPEMTIEDAVAAGCRTLVIGVANRGGRIETSWQDSMIRALQLGMDIAAGLHTRLTDLPAVAEVAKLEKRQLHDVRHPSRGFDVGTGEPRTGRRLLSVGTDCSVGKMYTSLALEAEMRARGMNASFRATGQTGILIWGDGVSVDAVVSDFVSGAVEWLAPANDEDHWDLIEGQGSLFHPSFAGVSMGLLHGAQAECLVMCHEPTRPHLRGLPGYQVPDIGMAIELNEQCARLTSPGARVVGLAVNTSAMAVDDARAYLSGLAERHGMPAVDPLRDGVGPIVDRLI